MLEMFWLVPAPIGALHSSPIRSVAQVGLWGRMAGNANEPTGMPVGSGVFAEYFYDCRRP